MLAVIVFGGGGATAPAAAVVAINDEMVVSAEDLKNRREVRAEDFRPTRQFLDPPRAARGDTPPMDIGAGQADLSARRARREADPEDVLALRKSRESCRGAPSTRPSEPLFDGPVYVGAGSASPTDAAVTEQGSHPRVLLAAATTIPAVLVTPLELHDDSVTVLAKVDKQGTLPVGARFIGSASASESRITIRFRALVLQDGRRFRVDAEAQDEAGAFGLSTDGVARTEDDDGRGSVVKEIAKETATDLVIGALGSGLASQTMDRYRRATSGRHRTRERVTVSVPAGTRILIFLTAPVHVEDGS